MRPPNEFRLPPNAAPDCKRRHDRAMRAWLADALDEQNIIAIDARTYETFCIMLARAGDPERLRELYPQFANCINAPKLAHGEKRPKLKHDRLRLAVDYVRRIRALWREQYGLTYLRKGEKSAENFAIEILHAGKSLTVGAIKAAGKPSGKHKPRRA
jgi:hypothetical protein